MEDRRGTVSSFNGPAPEIVVYKNVPLETEGVATWLRERLAEGFVPAEIGIFYRSDAEMPRAQSAAEAAGVPYRVLDDNVELGGGKASLATMHLAKGLEFRAVAVIACDDGVIPSEERIARIVDDSDLEEVYETERHLLYVACTRARDRLLVTAAGEHSEFLEDLAI